MKQLAQTIIILGSTALACSLDDTGESTGGTDNREGFAVVNSDYQSTSISLLDYDGEVLSGSIISSGSAATGLSAALSGDVVLPTQPVGGGELVLIDRSSPPVLTWLELKTGDVRAQLNVSTGFSSNPHDYVQLSPTKAYVPRFEPNLGSGKQPYDEGSDVLIVDPSIPEIIGRISLAPTLREHSEGFFARGDRALSEGGRVHVLVAAFAADFSAQLDGRIVTLDPESDRISSTLVFEGLKGCSSLALSPSQMQIAVACNGNFGQSPDSGFPDSGIVVVSLGDKLEETARFAAAHLGGEMISTVTYLDEETLVFTTLGRFDPNDPTKMAAPDTLRLLDLATGTLHGEPLYESQRVPFSLGDVHCAGNPRACLLSDAETDGGVVHWFRMPDLAHAQTIDIDDGIGLPPREIGGL